MPDMLEIGNVGAIGAIRDVPPYELSPEAWTIAENMRVHNGAMERLRGWASIFGVPGIAPMIGFPVRTSNAILWAYAGTTKIFGYDGTTHTDLSRAVGGAYAAQVPADWNYTLLANIPILNNGIDVPQFWAAPSLGTNWANLTNWPANQRARVVRALGPYLVALNNTDAGVSKPHLVHWSHPADPGSIPISWDYTDPTKDAGRKDLEDVESGILLDGLRLRGDLILYKESSVWRMSPIGGRFIFDFKTIFETIGLLATRCAAITGDGRRHVIATQDADMIVHDGNSFDSVLTRRQQERLAGDLDTANYANSFMFTNAPYGETWFCYPSQGNTTPNRALIWNYRENQKGVVTEVDGINFVAAAPGNIESAVAEAWNSGTDLWDDDTGPWSELIRRRVIVCGQAATKFYNLDSGLTRDGAAFTATLQRTGLSIIGRRRNGDWVVDFEKIKMLSRMLPKIQGGPVRIRVGSQMLVDGPVTWSDYFVFDPTDTVFADLITSGRAIAIEFSTTDSVAWRLDSYKLLINVLGAF